MVFEYAEQCLKIANDFLGKDVLSIQEVSKKSEIESFLDKKNVRLVKMPSLLMVITFIGRDISMRTYVPISNRGSIFKKCEAILKGFEDTCRTIMSKNYKY